MRTVYIATATLFLGLILGHVHAHREYARAIRRAELLYDGQREHNRQAYSLLGQAWERIEDDATRDLISRVSILLAIHPDVELPDSTGASVRPPILRTCSP